MLGQLAVVESLLIGGGEEGPCVADEGEGVLGEGEVVSERIEEGGELVGVFLNELGVAGEGVELENGVPVREAGGEGMVGSNEDLEDGEDLVRPT